ncbi:hypothetical protein [Streptomyces catenulae]|uniref:Uncharacterized protein n=1 Tax=Streptomyces catenulae TaxID=66875 RepID=A0ABV2Z7T4_9ACTN|nr:hypothetical protein [Streptomyces catenulae]
MGTNQPEDAEAVCDELDRALRAVGVALPSLAVDPLSYGSALPVVLIELGRCNLDTARRLTAVLRGAAG